MKKVAWTHIPHLNHLNKNIISKSKNSKNHWNKMDCSQKVYSSFENLSLGNKYTLQYLSSSKKVESMYIRLYRYNRTELTGTLFPWEYALDFATCDVRNILTLLVRNVTLWLHVSSGNRGLAG